AARLGPGVCELHLLGSAPGAARPRSALPPPRLRAAARRTQPAARRAGADHDPRHPPRARLARLADRRRRRPRRGRRGHRPPAPPPPAPPPRRPPPHPRPPGPGPAAGPPRAQPRFTAAQRRHTGRPLTQLPVTSRSRAAIRAPRCAVSDPTV